MRDISDSCRVTNPLCVRACVVCGAVGVSRAAEGFRDESIIWRHSPQEGREAEETDFTANGKSGLQRARTFRESGLLICLQPSFPLLLISGPC